MEEPKILHDHVVGWSEDMRYLLESVEAGRLAIEDAVGYFRLPNGQPLQSIYTMWTMLLGYRHFGQQTFVLGPHLQEMLENTSLVGVPWDAIKWPYPFFYVAVPGSTHKLWGGPTGWHKLTGILVGFSQDGTRMAVYLWGEENEKSRIVGDDASFWFDVPIQKVREEGADLETYLVSMMRDPTTNWADGSNAGIDTEDSGWLASAETMRQGPANEPTILLAKAALRIIINLCVYLQSKGSERSPHPKFEAQRKERQRLQEELGRKKNPNKKSAKSLLRELEKLSDAQVTWLGRSIEESARSGGGGGGGSSAVRHWVRGHWWPRLDNREARERHGIRWVHPYEKNRDAETQEPARHYQIASEKQP